MKRSDNFILQTLAGQNLLIPVAEKALNFNGVITLNDTGKYIWELLKHDLSVEQISKLVAEKYSIDLSLVEMDVSAFIASLKEDGCIEE